jgi:peptide chain release factor 1
MKELIFSLTRKDFKVDYYKGSGAGGQNRNKRETAVRITHIESGAVGECCEQREQLQNKKIAFDRLYNSKTFQIWFKKKCAIEMLSKEEKREIERKVIESMKEENLKIEYYEPK